MDSNALLEYYWYIDNVGPGAMDDFYALFFFKYYDPTAPLVAMWTCRNPSACAIVTLREVFESGLRVGTYRRMQRGVKSKSFHVHMSWMSICLREEKVILERRICDSVV